MNLASLKYKDYTWPLNPTTYKMTYEKNTAIHHYPDTNINEVDDMGMKPREVSGTGEFTGPDAYEEFKKLNSVYSKIGPGTLIHPIWNIQQAIFCKLELEQEPTPNYVRYSFGFIEHIPQVQVITQTKKIVASSRSKTKSSSNKKTKSVTHKVKKGENLTLIAKKYNTNWRDIAKRNPKIKNPNLLSVGQKIIVR